MNEKETCFVTSSLMWSELKKALEGNRFPQSLALSAPKQYHEKIAIDIARLLLCEKKNACGQCLSCCSWHEKTHPDLVLSGSLEKAPTIGECREIAVELSLYPVVASCRLVVIQSADTLLLPAANSMLKIVEEPPEHGVILFLLENDKFLPTLKSRCWNLALAHEERFEPEEIPSAERSWKKWLESGETMTIEELEKQLHCWETWAIEEGQASLAARVDRLRLICESRKLPQGMMLDLILLSLKEGFAFEHVFDNLW